MREWKDCVGEGWAPLVMLAEKAIIKAGGEIDQVKEKFGGLRIYVSKIEPFSEVDDLIEDVEALSFRVCEYCGAAGHQSEVGGWLKTLCQKCDNERAERKARVDSLSTPAHLTDPLAPPSSPT